MGGGRVAQVAHFPALAARRDVHMAGLVTSTGESMAESLNTWPIERSFSTLEAMLNEAALDAVFVLSPTVVHARHVESSLCAGLHVFCEKPLATNSAQVAHLVRLAEQEDLLLGVGFNRRHAATYRRARAEFGAANAQFCAVQKTGTGLQYRAVLENGIHMVDLLRFFCGEALQVTAHAVASDPYHEDGLLALVRFHGGEIGSLLAVRAAGAWDERLEAYGGGASVRVVIPDSITVERKGYQELSRSEPRASGWVEAADALGFRACVGDFLDAVKQQRQPLTNGRDALKTHLLLDEILTAAGLPTDHETIDASPEAS